MTIYGGGWAGFFLGGGGMGDIRPPLKFPPPPPSESVDD